MTEHGRPRLIFVLVLVLVNPFRVRNQFLRTLILFLLFPNLRTQQLNYPLAQMLCRNCRAWLWIPSFC